MYQTRNVVTLHLVSDVEFVNYTYMYDSTENTRTKRFGPYGKGQENVCEANSFFSQRTFFFQLTVSSFKQCVSLDFFVCIFPILSKLVQ